jgi:hypothetical protein
MRAPAIIAPGKSYSSKENPMPQRRLIGVAIILGLAIIAAHWQGFAADDEKEKDAAGPRAGSAKARLEAARTVYEASWTRHVQAANEFPFNLDYFHDWSARWLQAERDLSRTRAEQIAALEGHLKRMQFFKDLLDRNLRDGTVGRYEPRAAEFFVLEAEDWLAAAKAELK